MPKPYELDLRAKVMTLVDAGLSLHQAADRFGVAPSTVWRWRQRRQRSGELAASPMGGKRSKLELYVDWFAKLKARRPLVTPRGAHAELQLLGVAASYATVRRFMIKHGWAQGKPGG